MWRALARRADNVAKLLAKHNLSMPERCALVNHLAKTFQAHQSLPRNSRAEQQPFVTRWAIALSNAARHGNQFWVTSLGKAADLKAVALEKIVASSKRKAWRIAIGAKAEADTTRKPTPTKVAYRWVRGTAKWTPAPVGSASLNHAVPEPSDKDNDDNELYVEHLGLQASALDSSLVPLCDQANVDVIANSWATLWQENDMYIEPQIDVSDE